MEFQFVFNQNSGKKTKGCYSGASFDGYVDQVSTEFGLRLIFPVAFKVIDVDGTVPSTEAVLLADARHICVSREGSFALVSYGNGDFPQLWQIQDRIGTIQLELCREYAPPRSSSSSHELPKISGKARFW